MLQLLRLALRDGGVKQRQVHRDIRIHMGHIHKLLPHIQLHRQLLPAFPDQSGLLTFPRLYLAANKFPKQPPGLVGRSAADEKSVFPPDQRRHHFRDLHSLTCFFFR